MLEGSIDRPRDQNEAATSSQPSADAIIPSKSMMRESQNRLGAFDSLSDFWKVVIDGAEGECAIKKGVDACRRRHKNGDADKSVGGFPCPTHRVRLEVMIVRRHDPRAGTRSYQRR